MSEEQKNISADEMKQFLQCIINKTKIKNGKSSEFNSKKTNNEFYGHTETNWSNDRLITAGIADCNLELNEKNSSNSLWSNLIACQPNSAMLRSVTLCICAHNNATSLHDKNCGAGNTNGAIKKYLMQESASDSGLNPKPEQEAELGLFPSINLGYKYSGGSSNDFKKTQSLELADKSKDLNLLGVNTRICKDSKNENTFCLGRIDTSDHKKDIKIMRETLYISSKCYDSDYLSKMAVVNNHGFVGESRSDIQSAYHEHGYNHNKKESKHKGKVTELDVCNRILAELYDINDVNNNSTEAQYTNTLMPISYNNSIDTADTGYIGSQYDNMEEEDIAEQLMQELLTFNNDRLENIQQSSLNEQAQQEILPQRTENVESFDIFVGRPKGKKVGLTVSDIRKIAVKEYGCHLIGKDNTECAICLSSYKLGNLVLELVCTHVFHKKCIKPWLKLHGICPICRCHAINCEKG